LLSTSAALVIALSPTAIEMVEKFQCNRVEVS